MNNKDFVPTNAFSHSVFVARNPQLHKDRHQTLYTHLCELVTDWILHTHKAIDRDSIASLIEWAEKQASNPTKEGG